MILVLKRFLVKILHKKKLKTQDYFLNIDVLPSKIKKIELNISKGYITFVNPFHSNGSYRFFSDRNLIKIFMIINLTLYRYSKHTVFHKKT